MGVRNMFIFCKVRNNTMDLAMEQADMFSYWPRGTKDVGPEGIYGAQYAGLKWEEDPDLSNYMKHIHNILTCQEKKEAQIIRMLQYEWSNTSFLALEMGDGDLGQKFRRL